MSRVINKAVFALVLLLVGGAINIFACRCVAPGGESLAAAVKAAAENSTAVFAGKVVSFEYRKNTPTEQPDSRAGETGEQIEYETKIVKFRVDKWWKGEAASEILLVTKEVKASNGITSFSTCDYEFEAGESYLIYAVGEAGEIRTNRCTRTKPLSHTKDVQILEELLKS